MTPKEQFDVVVIGAGSAGLTAAVGFSKIGKKVLLIEKEHMGGECTNSGCIPSKALLHHAKVFASARKVAESSPSLESYRTRALEYVREKIAEVRAEEEPADFEKLGITVVLGEAEFTAPCTVRVSEKHYGFKTAIIATGSLPRTVEVPGLSEEDTLTNQNVFTVEKIPSRLLVVGAGPIGLELGQAFALLGSEVTVVAREDTFSPGADAAVAKVQKEALERTGVRILLGATLEHVEGGEGVVKFHTGDNSSTERVPFDKVLIAIGRVPQFPKGLEAASIQCDEKCVLVDSQYRTSNKDVYAIGDVAQADKFTHAADDTARQVVARIASHKLLRINTKKPLPKVTYTDPEVATVGLTHTEACKKYDSREIMRIEVPYSANDRAKTDSASGGVMVVVARRLGGTVLGAHIAGPAAGELLSVFTLAIDRKINLWRLRSIIYPYPTYSLLIKKVSDTFFAETIANLKPDLKFFAFKHAPKLVALVFWATLFLFFQNYRSVHNLTYLEMIRMLADFISTNPLGPVLYMLAYAIRPLIFFPATLMTALSGALFGLPLGVLYTVVGENMSANLAYWVGRFFGKGFNFEDSFLGNWIEALRKRPFSAILFTRLFYFPFDLTNYASGILKVKWSAYALATVIGIMPGLVTFVALGAGIEDITNFELSFDAFNFTNIAIAITVFVVSLSLSRLLRKWQPREATQ